MQVWINHLSMQHVSFHHNSKHLTVFSSIRTCSSTPSSRKSSRTSPMTSSITDLYSLGYNESKQIESLLTTELQNITIQYYELIIFKWIDWISSEYQYIWFVYKLDWKTHWPQWTKHLLRCDSWWAKKLMIEMIWMNWELTNEEESYFNGLVAETLKNKGISNMFTVWLFAKYQKQWFV